MNIYPVLSAFHKYLPSLNLPEPHSTTQLFEQPRHRVKETSQLCASKRNGNRPRILQGRYHGHMANEFPGIMTRLSGVLVKYTTAVKALDDRGLLIPSDSKILRLD